MILPFKLRVLFFQVMADVRTPEMIRHMHVLHDFVRCEQILEWLVKNKKTGQEFLVFLREHEGSVLKAGSEVLRRIHRETERHPIFAGRDFRG